MTIEKTKAQRAEASASKENPQPSKDVFCSICLDAVENAGDRSVARLKCGHQFHLDCIGSAFNAKGAMECPNCRQIEGGQWLFSSGSYLQQQLLSNSTSEEDPGLLYSRSTHVSHANRRLPYVTHRQVPVESENLLATNRWRSDIPSWLQNVNDVAGLPSTGGVYIQGSQTSNMHRHSLYGSVLPNSHILDGPMPRQWIDENNFLYRYEPAMNHRYSTNRGDRDREGREHAFGGLSLPTNDANLEQPVSASQIGGRRLGAYAAGIPSGHELGNSHESLHRFFANPFSGEVHHLHSLNRAGSHIYYNGRNFGAGVSWL